MSLLAEATRKALDELNEYRNRLQAFSDSAPEVGKIQIHTLGWNGDHATSDEEEPTVSLHCRVFINGVEVPGVTGITTDFSHDFAETTVRLLGPVEVVTHDRESWAKL